MHDNGHVMLALFLAWKGSRFNWHVEAAPTYLTHLHWLLTFFHTLLVAVAVPNKLVLAVFDFLGCRICVAGLASRSIVFVELVFPYASCISDWHLGVMFMPFKSPLLHRCNLGFLKETSSEGCVSCEMVHGRNRWMKNPLVTVIYEHAKKYSSM
jgi:hypothetical protein